MVAAHSAVPPFWWVPTCRDNTTEFPPSQMRHCMCPPPPCLCTCWSLFWDAFCPSSILTFHNPKLSAPANYLHCSKPVQSPFPRESFLSFSFFLTTPQGGRILIPWPGDWNPRSLQRKCGAVTTGPLGNPEEVFSYPWVTGRADCHFGTISEFLIIPYCN